MPIYSGFGAEDIPEVDNLAEDNPEADSLVVDVLPEDSLVEGVEEVLA
jgi:hypothetical protein